MCLLYHWIRTRRICYLFKKDKFCPKFCWKIVDFCAYVWPLGVSNGKNQPKIRCKNSWHWLVILMFTTVWQIFAGRKQNEQAGKLCQNAENCFIKLIKSNQLNLFLVGSSHLEPLFGSHVGNSSASQLSFFFLFTTHRVSRQTVNLRFENSQLFFKSRLILADNTRL